MDKIILIRLGEIFLKGKNRNFFEKILISNIKSKLNGIDCKLYFGRNRYVVSDFSDNDVEIISAILCKIFGIHSISVGYRTNSDFDNIVKTTNSVIKKIGTFKVDANRGDKTYPMTSVQIAATLGGRLLELNNGLSVDLHNPDFIINVDIREDGQTYIYSEKLVGAGGMPVGSAGKGLLLLSGGIDSPVAGYMMAKRGMYMDALHFHSFPYTSEMALKKVEKLSQIMQSYCNKINLITVPFTEIQESINKYCNNNYMITLMRRFMMQIAEQIAIKRNCSCIINGESLGQVASQTIQSITVTNEQVKTMPILRPLIGMDKQEILDISIKIGTYETSILPYEDCCTVFLPKNPVTKPTLEHCIYEEAKIPNKNELVENAISKIIISNH